MVHTPELWRVESGAIKAHKEGIGDVWVAMADRDDPNTAPVERDENMKRIVACVNFCQGLALKGQQSTLLDALDETLEHLGLIPGGAYNDPWKALEAIRQRWNETHPDDEEALIAAYEERESQAMARSVMDPQHAHIGSVDAGVTEQVVVLYRRCPNCNAPMTWDSSTLVCAGCGQLF